MGSLGGSIDGLPPWWKKAAISLGSAAALAVVIQQLQRQKAGTGGARGFARVLCVRASGDQAAAPAGSHVVTPATLFQAADNFESVTVVCSDVKAFFQLDMTLLQSCLEKVAPGGVITAQLAGLTEEDVQSLDTAALFAGAIDAKLEEVATSADRTSSVTFVCSKPPWSTGASVSLGGAARIDEDELLGEVPAPVGKGKSDCSTQPKACANCSCGRAELEDKHGADEAKKLLETGKERSACGSCYLGDAFRCETCPYRGLPAFKPGNKVELSSGETEGTGQFGIKVDVDAGNDGGELGAGEVTTAGGKLVIGV